MSKRLWSAALLVLVALLAGLMAGCIGPGGLKGDPLAGTSWTLAQLGDAVALQGSEVTLQFDEGGVGGLAGCNHYGGEYAVDGHGLTLGPLHSTLMACADEHITAQEGRYLQALGQVERFELKGGRLYLYGADGLTVVLAGAD
ncbi:MAG: META domain-containing protein [Chloroflexi bacterium]|jgi:heat shock protein HslJ|nr:META domain-containing protein [Chloroflexota bacterium]